MSDYQARLAIRPFGQLVDLVLDDNLQGRQGELYRVPYVLSDNVLIIVPVYVPGTRNVFPWNGRMPGFQGSRKPTRGFANNLKAPGNGIDRSHLRKKSLVVKARDEALGKLDMMQNVTKGGERGL
jgi:hypothetical protein